MHSGFRCVRLHFRVTVFSYHIGNVYNTRFDHGRYAFIFDLQSGRVSLNQMFAYPTVNAWTTDGKNKSIDTVKKTMAKNNIRFTRYSFKQKGGLFEQNILKKSNGQIPIKSDSPIENIDKYGGYKVVKRFYFLNIIVTCLRVV